MICDECQALYEEVGDRVRKPEVFAKVRRTDERLKCWAKGIEAEAYYLVYTNDPHDTVYVSLVTPDRWLSESIEADLVHSGDKLEELLEEELADQGFDGSLPVEHFRDDEKLFVFRSPVRLPEGEELDGPAMTDRTTQALLAYEAAFRELGDMTPEDD